MNGDAEPRVLAIDVRTVLLRAVRPDDEDGGESVRLIAARAERSTRTVYRCLSSGPDDSIPLDLADRLCLAAGGHLSECRLVMPSGAVVGYLD